MKYCKKCDTEKPKTEFGKNKGTKDGLRSNCKACKNATSRKHRDANPGLNASVCSAYYYANRDARLAHDKMTREKFPERKSANDRAYYLANKEKICATVSVYKKKHPDKVLEIVRSRRARKHGADGSHTAEDVSRIFELQRGICASCPKKLIRSGKNKFHIDHIMPLSRGGSDFPSNIQCLCPECNMRKSAKDPLDWAKENGKLL